jgi:hypothetical protein
VERKKCGGIHFINFLNDRTGDDKICLELENIFFSLFTNLQNLQNLQNKKNNIIKL